MKTIVLSSLIAFCLLLEARSFPSQNEKPNGTETKKSESSCDSYTEFKKKQKAAKAKQTATAPKEAVKK